MKKNYKKMIKILFVFAIILVVVTFIKMKMLDVVIANEDGPLARLFGEFLKVSSGDYYTGKEYATLFLGIFTLFGAFVAFAAYIVYLVLGAIGVFGLLGECILILIASIFDSDKDKAKWQEVVAAMILIFASLLHFSIIYVYISLFTSFIIEIGIFIGIYIWCVYLYIHGKREDKELVSTENTQEVIEEKETEVLDEKK